MIEALEGLAPEATPLDQADGRWLAKSVLARRDQPPFDVSAMDGWAVRAADVSAGVRLAVVGESAAGAPNRLGIGPGEAVRIFTGAPMPTGADAVLIQERAVRHGDAVLVEDPQIEPAHLRPRAGDFSDGGLLLKAGERLNPWRLALAASAGLGEVECRRSPRVAILANGDELVEPGEPAEPHQIFNAAGPALAAFAARWGAKAQLLGIAGDTEAEIQSRVQGAEFDLLVTIGGASVGDYDRVKPALQALGVALHLEGCAVRPGKPVWFGTWGDGRAVLGLPGNPASALVCAELFLGPVLAALQGGVSTPRIETAKLDQALGANGPREHYMRAVIFQDESGANCVRAFGNQDSSLVSVMAAAN
ncbi:hypothetical protein LTR94_024548, partial [Friedmanniomyces endolithicus]